MNTAATREELEQILDQALQDVTERTAGVRLHQGDQPLGEDLCTVHITFDKGFGTSLTLCADTSLLARMARNSFHEDAVTPEDVEGSEAQFILTYADEHKEGAQLIHHVPSPHEDGPVSHETEQEGDIK